MSSYAYCRHKGCEAPLSRPTLFEIQYDTWKCTLGHHNELPYDATTLLAEWVGELMERVEALEND